MNIKLNAIPCLLTAVFITGCSSDDDDAGDDLIGADNQTSMPAPGFDQSEAPLVLNRFNGNYLRACTERSDEPGVWDLLEISVENEVIVSTQTEFSDAECSQPDSQVVTTSSVVYSGGTTETLLGLADHVSLTIEGITANGISGTDTGQTAFDLFLLDGNNLHTGLITDDTEAVSEDTRPTEIDPEPIATRL